MKFNEQQQRTIGFSDLWMDVSGLPTYSNLFAANGEMKAFVERVSRLNRDAGEIGAGMLAQLVDEARAILAKVEG